MTGFIDKICGDCCYDPDLVSGYSDEEIRKIELLYDIKVTGDFYDFMNDMGRCDGGLVGGYPINLYRTSMTVRRHILFQLRLESDFKEFQIEAGLKLLNYKPFIFSWESETQYFFSGNIFRNPRKGLSI